MKSFSLKAVLHLLLLSSVVAMLAACAGGATNSGVSNEEVLWPAESSVPRIVFERSLSKPEDLDISQGLIGFLKSIAFGEKDTSMVLPMAVVPNERGQLFVADAGRKGIHRFDTKRGNYRLIKRSDDRGFLTPVGMDTDQAGNVFVTDSELAKVFVIAVDENHARPLPLAEDFVRPTGIAIDKKTGWMYIVDTGLHAVYVFSSDNKLIRKFGQRGALEGEFNFPTYIWQNGKGNLLVTDSLNFRIQVFDRFGGFLRKFGSVGDGSGSQARSKGVAEDSEGHIYVTDSLFHTVQIFDESGRFLLNFGEQGNGPGKFWLPTDIHITQDGTIYVADSYNKRVQVFRYLGTEL